jgi:Antitoxin Phd_YefM, type II toxin-antitoxin system
MDRRIDAHIARTQFGQIIHLATKNNERFIVDRRGEPAVVIMSVQDFIRTAAPPPDWLEKAWTGAKQRGLDELTPADIDDEIARLPAQEGSGPRRAVVIRAVIDTNVLVSGLLSPPGSLPGEMKRLSSWRSIKAWSIPASRKRCWKNMRLCSRARNLRFDPTSSLPSSPCSASKANSITRPPRWRFL